MLPIGALGLSSAKFLLAGTWISQVTRENSTGKAILVSVLVMLAR
jgi:hypothetical protein